MEDIGQGSGMHGEPTTPEYYIRNMTEDQLKTDYRDCVHAIRFYQEVDDKPRYLDEKCYLELLEVEFHNRCLELPVVN